MIAVTNQTKIDCNSENISYKEYIVIDSTTIEIKGKMSNTAYKDGNFIGTFNLKMLEFTTENDIDYKKKEFAYWKSVNGTAFKIGTYIVTDVTDNDTEEEVKVTAMDYGLKFAIPYTTALDYSTGTVTLKNVLDEICTSLGVTLSNATITNGDFIVDSNQFVNGELYGDVIAYIAGITGDFATINDSDELEFIFNTVTDEIIEDYVDLDDKRDTRPITVVVLGNKNITGQEAVRTWTEGVALYGENYLKINDNLFAYTLEKREALIDAIYNKVKGFGYSAFESKYSFKPYMQLGDLVQFKNKNGTLVSSIVLKIDTDYDDITLSAPSVTDASVDYELTQTALDVAKRAEIIANQADASVTILTGTVEALEGSIEVLRADLDTNIVIVSVDSDNKPLASSNTDINYSIKYLGEAITLQPTTSDTYTGITTTITDTYIRFAVNSSVAIPLTDNKYTFTWNKVVGETTYTVTRTIIVSTIAQTTSYIESTTEPADTSVLWFDTTANQLKRYETDTWVVVNDYSSDIEQINDDLSNYGERISSVETVQTDQALTINIISTNIDTTNGDIQRVETTNGFSFSEDGLYIYDQDSEFSALHKINGSFYYDGDKIINSITTRGTDVFFLFNFGRSYYGALDDVPETDYNFVAYTYTNPDTSEIGFGHFYNGGD